eukprot:3598319-Prymnesium_polylepis.1
MFLEKTCLGAAASRAERRFFVGVCRAATMAHIAVFGNTYTLDEDGKVQVQWAIGKWKLFERRKPRGEPQESLIALQKRVEEKVVDLQREQPAAKVAAEAEERRNSTRFASPGPASTRQLRQHGETGKPSPESAEKMAPPPPRKRADT